MKINLDEYDKVLALISGLFKFEENSPFSQAALAVTEDEFFVYDDHRPTDRNGGAYHYVIKKRFDIDDYRFVLDERLIKNPDLEPYGRLYFYGEDADDSFEFYYLISDRKEKIKFLKQLKELGLPNIKKVTKIKATKF